jgi:MFS family permease
MMAEEDDSHDSHREFGHLLEELRVSLPGAEIIFAFLLTVPFTSRYEEVTVDQQNTYFVAFISAALAVAFLIAPALLHRIQRKPDNMERLLRTATLLTIIGTGCMAITITAVVYLITELLFGVAVGAIVSAGMAGLIVALWFGLPLYRKL